MYHLDCTAVVLPIFLGLSQIVKNSLQIKLDADIFIYTQIAYYRTFTPGEQNLSNFAKLYKLLLLLIATVSVA